jgi:hypothetical protein
MSRSRLGGWRWAAAAVLVAVLVLGLGFVLRGAGLGAAANVAQLVSLAPLIAGMVGWARTRHTAQARADDLPVALGLVLRTIADAQGLTGEDLRTCLQQWGGDTVDAYLDGTRRPGWDFVTAFLNVVAGDDRLRRELLERRVRQMWNQAAGASASVGSSEAAAVERVLVVLPETGEWLTALRKVADMQQMVGDIHKAISRYEILETGLAAMLDRLSQAVTLLAAERDELREELAARHDNGLGGEPGHRMRDELEDLRRQLRDTQQRLSDAEQLRAATAQRLEVSERQRQLAERLKDEAMAHAEQARRRLAKLENHPAAAAPRLAAIQQLADDTESAAMVDTDRQVAEEVLDRVDRVLREEAVKLSQLGEKLTSTLAAKPGPGQETTRAPGRRRERPSETIRAAWRRQGKMHKTIITMLGAVAVSVLAVLILKPSSSVSCSYMAYCPVVEGSLHEGAFAEKIWPNYTDPRGYVAGLNNVPAAVIVEVKNVPAAREYTLTIRYANGLANDGKAEPRSLSILVDGDAQSVAAGPAATLSGEAVRFGKAAFPVTPSWSDWELTTVRVALKKGIDYIALACLSGDTCHVNVDWIQIR